MDPGVTLWEMNPKCGLTGVAQGEYAEYGVDLSMNPR